VAEPGRTAREGRLLSFVLWAPLVAMKLEALQAVGSFGLDGSYYTDVARQVRDGHGLQSYLSMYHAGFSYFPHPTPIYPVWPLVLGYASRVLPLDVAAVLLPTLCYVGTVALFAGLARRVRPGPLFPGLWDAVDAGHLAVLLFGYNALFFEATTKPYTEGLGYLGLAMLLWRVRAVFGAPSVRGGLELGAWCGFLILVRSQMFLLTLVGAGTGVWALLFLRPFSRWAAIVGAAVAGWFLVLAPQMVWLSTFVAHPGLDTLLRFEHYHESDVLAPVTMLEPAKSVLRLLQDRAHGFKLAYASTGTYSYENAFGVLHWAPLLWAPFLLVDLVRGLGTGGLARLRAAAADPASGFAVFYGFLALGGFFSIHWLHKSYGAEWNFATRHALTVLFLFGGAVVALANRGGLARLLAVAVLALTMRSTLTGLDAWVEKEVKDDAPQQFWKGGLQEFLREEQRKDPQLVVVMEDPQRYARAMPGIGFHWLWPETRYADVQRMFTELGADYLLVPLDKKRHKWLDKKKIAAQFERVRQNVNGFDVYRYVPTSGGGGDDAR
jgi:hypothetical protein